ncbi:hypothetical protein K490DRAFT_43879 [Saccharata proteae CBS 121410]|uniref:Brl1/Brr6 domain-containing protein n=1 Tax=Saccharata proteae CBS 121410 TaxID=1314787 RepID=A0A9P4HU95_9PEZI|nr:hypothetical protein K490DRAFT_43879 [Saccharata proteae CBS 121410]
MNRRTGHTPMDFEYTNRTGPIDESSPFITAARNAQNGAGRKREHGALNAANQQQTPSLRPPASQPYFFSQPWGSGATGPATTTPARCKTDGKPLPAVPNHLKDPKFTTPRKLDIDFSSGGETPDTPAENADSEATPESSLMGFRNRVALFTSGSRSPKKGGAGSPVKEKRRDSWIMKRRVNGGKSRDRGGRRGDEYYDDDDNNNNDGSRRGSNDNDNNTSTTPPAAKTPLIAAILSYIETHPALPHILSYYAQLLLNFFIVFAIIYAVYTFWTAIQSDVNLASDRAVAETLAEMAVCAQNYRENRCERDTRMPALEVVCENWEKCMGRDPKKVGRARVSAHTFAMIFNSFIEPISYKAMLFSLIIIFGCVAMSNLAFGFFRNKHAHQHQHPIHPQDHLPHQQYLPGATATVPPTPARHFAANLYDAPGPGYWTPHHGAQQWQGQGLEPGPSARPGEGGSPVKQIQW